MITFKQYITELFEKPYPFTQTDSIDTNLQMGIDLINNGSFDPEEHEENGGLAMDEARYSFSTKDGRKYVVEFEYELNVLQIARKSFSKCGIGFRSVGAVERKNKASESDYEVTGEGDEFRVMSTVMEIISDEISNTSPTVIEFSSAKSQATTKDKDKIAKTGRTKLYKTMVKRFAGKMGYRVVKIIDGDYMANFILRQKK